MSTIELVNPVVPEGPPPANLRMAQRQPLGPGARITLIDNGKPRSYPIRCRQKTIYNSRPMPLRSSIRSNNS